MSPRDDDDEDKVGATDPIDLPLVDRRFNEADDQIAPGTGPAIGPAPFVKDKHDATTRRALAFTVIGLVAVLYGAAVLGILAGWISSDELGKVALVLGPIQALAAAVLGFYFGQDQSK
ncbi:hypothetical protein AX769_21840 (plasmid) [Frondihabitans sp. PAMC 28766]|uniref:hypothetical protein n=1 Tax=Frondihabitans sp. PAMC 28766 TaxID=1795630 RepID=UPI00078DDE80|nr:hypothetical protein [Frondihabitans sp. PAMC 28766]AMM22781.1 hypothetical protein AX769_21840 [Frondihabitans sp. PAMC 28766]